MVTAGLGIACAVLRIVLNLFGITFNSFNRMNSFPGQNPEMVRAFQMGSGVAGIFIAIIQVAVAIFILYAALKMKGLQQYGLCIAASIVAMVPCISPCCCIGIPIGIWALVVLNKSEVRDYFS